ncbi:Uncharacterised protein [Mycobacteroides abscessus]|nr:Uncharacterised protein [Mycobacteroides abscessus]
MLTLVPAPPWNTSTGNWSRHRPSRRIASHAATIASATSRWMVRSSRFASADAFLTITMPRTISGTSLTVVPEMRKFSMARTVWTP